MTSDDILRNIGKWMGSFSFHPEGRAFNEVLQEIGEHIQELQQENQELKAHVENLRKDLTIAVKHLCNPLGILKATAGLCRSSLKQTPKQSLAAIKAEAIKDATYDALPLSIANSPFEPSSYEQGFLEAIEKVNEYADNLIASDSEALKGEG